MNLVQRLKDAYKEGLEATSPKGNLLLTDDQDRKITDLRRIRETTPHDSFLEVVAYSIGARVGLRLEPYKLFNFYFG